MFQKSGVISGGAYDLQRKAQRWEEKEVTGLRQERDQFRVSILFVARVYIIGLIVHPTTAS